MVIQSAWNTVTNKNPFLTSILKAKYFPNDSFWTATNYGPRSIFWSSVLQVRQDLSTNSIYQIHAGNTSIWSAPWNAIWNTIHDHLLLPVTTSPLPTTVSDLWIPGTRSWNLQLLSNTFTDQATQTIAATQPIQSDHHDILRWTPTKNGLCTTKSIYKHLSTQQITPLPLQGSRSINHNANQILQKAWKSKILPPLLKAFTWRLIRRALATAERAAGYSTHIDQHCAHCGAVENDFHLFFQCDLPRAVWFTANPPFTIDTIPPEDDGIQLTLPCLITPSPTDEILCKTIFTLWYIWKARNDNRFQRKTWNPWQVHHAVAAHLNTHKLALLQVTECGRTDPPLTTNSSGMTNTNAGMRTPPEAMENDQQEDATWRSALMNNMVSIQQGLLPANTNITTTGNNSPTNQMHRFMATEAPRHIVSFPVLLQGSRCYMDASTMPHQVSSLPRKAGIGVFIINTQVQPPQKIYIKAAMQHSTSVLMAEAAALALATAITAHMHLQHTNFLSDSQQMVDFLNSSDHSNPPNWRIKYLTQLFDNFSCNRSTATFKIQRNQNQTADALARQALRETESSTPVVSYCCSHSDHANQCTLPLALQSVTIDSVMVLSARCC